MTYRKRSSPLTTTSNGCMIGDFKMTPPGRILARFGNDMGVVDKMLMAALNASGGQARDAWCL